MQQVGVSITKLAAHTSIGDEAGKEARRQELAAKRALKAAQRAKLSSQPVRKSRRQAGEEAILGHQPALNYSLELLSMRTKGNSAVHLMDAVDNDGKTFLKNVASSSKIPSAFEIDSVDDEVEYSLAKNDALHCNCIERSHHGEGEEEDDDEDSEEQDSGLTEYERKRRENIQRNLAFMQQMGVSTAKIAARTAVGDDPAQEKKKQQLAIKRALQAARRAELLAQPVRKSRRLEGKKVEVEPIERIDLYEMGDKLPAHRQPRGSHLHVMDAVDGESKAFLGGITADLEEDEELEEDTILDDDDGVEYTLADDDITKAVQERIYSVAFLPRADRVVVACGDKMGHVALWTPPNESSMKQESLAAPLAIYRPHYTPVSQLIFPDSSKLVSSSFDGTVREFDLRAAESSVVYDTSDNAGISSLVAAGTAQCYYASCDDGTVRLIDRRARKVQTSVYELHEKKINTVSQHPSLDL
ncbi:hypothetical protein PHYSODRAFT_520436 [Phytophthora sojae]|uniref:Uncharacterized protein n=1 Tax=Phytophthora sojae (strain P6497) TaxID=1094619 RepID=G5A1N4_PHYSP|nr:hypothetical protein PHYSODRAFT_520436 [Phytophthora sojae]EGZ10832.1 hypothetical protein PHYSODRAFT_520436 [Phytophthora sojae]|eukprot:XP_009533577.1 hypothetical protein PHYSODRAFT_520436 [Phytophthora sojae]